MARVPDPPDLVKALTAIRRELRRILLDHPRRREYLRAVRLAARVMAEVALHSQTPTTTPEDTLRAAGIDDARQATYQRKFSTLLAGKAGA